jgi:hypothetical protein
MGRFLFCSHPVFALNERFRPNRVLGRDQVLTLNGVFARKGVEILVVGT